MDSGNPSETPAAKDTKHVLIAHEEVSTMRLIRETLLNFTQSTVDTSPDGEYAFERALRKRYDLFIFSLSMPVLHGELLDSLITKAYSFCHEGARVAPPVIFLGEKSDALRVEELQRDPRVKGVLVKPINIERVIAKAREILPAKEPI